MQPIIRTQQARIRGATSNPIGQLPVYPVYQTYLPLVLGILSIAIALGNQIALLTGVLFGAATLIIRVLTKPKES
jgi:hypothetical protein